eukprot:1045831-Lingulodinium_polyedra.AAC.1
MAYGRFDRIAPRNDAVDSIAFRHNGSQDLQTCMLVGGDVIAFAFFAYIMKHNVANMINNAA